MSITKSHYYMIKTLQMRRVFSQSEKTLFICKLLIYNIDILIVTLYMVVGWIDLNTWFSLGIPKWRTYVLLHRIFETTSINHELLLVSRKTFLQDFQKSSKFSKKCVLFIYDSRIGRVTNSQMTVEKIKYKISRPWRVN